MDSRSVILTHSQIAAKIDDMERFIVNAAVLHGLPYIPLLPSVRAFALMEVSWTQFVKEYRRAVIVAMRSGQNFAYMD